MKVRFWGTRGSIPASLTAAQVRDKLITALLGATHVNLNKAAEVERYVEGLDLAVGGSFGGHTSCVQIDTGGKEHVILDLGSGARPLANHFSRQFGKIPQTYHVFMSHLHWDHIMGFPFFTPAYIPGNRIVIHGCHAELEYAFRRQHTAPSFPVEFDDLGADIEFDVLEVGQSYEIAGLKFTAKKQRHSGDSYGWCIEDGKSKVIYTTDSEHDLKDIEERVAFADFFRNADLVIFDAMYSLADAISIRQDWGHSSNIVGVELCQLGGVKQLCLFHHDPAYNDARILQVLDQAKRFEALTRERFQPLDIISAWDGLVVSL